MFARYDQDLTPFFAKIQAEQLARRERRRRQRRENWETFLRLLGLRPHGRRS